MGRTHFAPRFIWTALLAVATTAALAAETSPDVKHEVQRRTLTVALDGSGCIVHCLVGGHKQPWPVSARTTLGDCKATGETSVAKNLGGCAFTRKLTDAQGHTATVTERFSPDGDGVRWDVEISSQGDPWTTPIVSQVACAPPETKLFWTAWGSPDFSGQNLTPELASLVQSGKASVTGAWADPLAPVGFLNRSWHYGNVTQSCPVGSDYVALPLFTILDPKTDTGLSLVLSPDDILLNLDLQVTASGHISYSRINHRLGGGKVLKLTMHLVPHEASWRGGLRFLTARYPQFFDTPNPRSHKIGGCGAYSTGEQEIDVAKFKLMALGFNWKLSDDFPYMGMFIPPVKDAEEKWQRSCDEDSAAYKGPTSSCRVMNDYAKYMKRNGFAVLSYFNVTEFGKNMYGRKPERQAEDPELWKDPAGYIQHKLPRAVVDPRISTCYNAYIVDPGDPGYRAFLLEQAERNTKMLPDTDGICIDRADWLRLYNRRADDGVSWLDGKPARSLFRSWSDLMSRLGPQMHQADKLIYSNLMTMRLELCRELDGIYTEFGNNGNALNASALLGLRKPVVCWTYNESLNEPDPDAFMQRHLHMGCFPTAPYPWNNHCINPEPKADKLYCAYGPLLSALRGKKWVLAAHCVESATPGVKVNLFEVPGGYALPVTFGGKAATATATVRVRNIPGLEKMKCIALHPGREVASPATSHFRDGVLELTVPLVSGCAMITMTQLSPVESPRMSSYFPQAVARITWTSSRGIRQSGLKAVTSGAHLKDGGGAFHLRELHALRRFRGPARLRHFGGILRRDIHGRRRVGRNRDLHCQSLAIAIPVACNASVD